MIDAGYSIQMSRDDKSATITFRAEEPITWRKAIELLRDLADQLESEHEDDGEEAYQ